MFKDSLNVSKESPLHEEMDGVMGAMMSDECCHLMANEKAYFQYNQKHELDSYLQHVHTQRHIHRRGHGLVCLPCRRGRGDCKGGRGVNCIIIKYFVRGSKYQK